MRHPIVASQFYESNAKELREQINKCFISGPGSLPGKITKKTVGVISPHAGFMFSGACQAFAYKEIAESPIPETFVLLGLSHQGYSSCVSLEDWKTPLGIVKTDKEFQEILAGSLPINEDVHANEHSIEVQIPFLQFLFKKPKIAAIIASPDKDFVEIADAIYDTIKKTRRKTRIIASSDFTHFGNSYGYLPFTENIKENMYKLDKGAIDLVIDKNSKGFLSYTQDTGATICGRYPIAVFMELCKRLGAKNSSLLKYYTSGDVINDYSNAVGYASIEFN